MGLKILGRLALNLLRPHLWVGICLLMGSSSRLNALDPSRSIHQYSHDQWNRRFGLPGTTVEGLFQSPDGYLWLHSAGGLFRFDGVRFVPMPLGLEGKPEGAVGENLRAMGPAKNGGLMLRTSGRILRLEGGRIAQIASDLKVPDGMDRMIMEARDGSIWIGTDNHIYRVQNGRLELIARGVGWVRAFCEDRHGAIWISTSSALYRYHQGRMMPLACTQSGAAKVSLPLEDPPSGLGGVVFPDLSTALLEDSGGVLWIGTLRGIKKWANGKLVQDAETKGFGDAPVTALCQDRDGNVWVGTDGRGLYRLVQGKWSRLTHHEGLSDDNVLALQEDREGDLWIGTRNGLDQLRDAPLQTISTQDGLLDDNIRTVVEGPDGSIYGFALGGSIARLKGGAIRTYTKQDGLTNSYSGCLFLSRDGTLWAGSGRGLSALRGDRWQTYTDGGKLLSLFISAITEDDESLILACSNLNLYRFRDGRLSPYNLRLSRPEDVRYVFSMLKDPEGTLWFGTSAGLYRLDRHQGPEKAVCTAFKDPAVSLYDDGLGYLWITGRDTPGFTRLDKRDGGLVRYTPEAGAVSGGIGRILSDSANNLWMNTRTGIVTFQRAELDAFAAGKALKIHGTTYDSLDGLRTDDCTGDEKQPAAWRTQDGRLLFSSPRGLVIVDPARLSRNVLPPTVLIEALRADNVAQSRDVPMVFSPGQKNVEISYSATSLQVPMRVRFKYKLEGYDPDWIEAGSRRVAYYTKLPPGRYVFRVIAANNDGVWNTEGTSIAIRQLPHFYQTVWFLFLVILALAGGGIGLHRFRMRLHIRAERELQTKVTESLAHIKALHGLLPICAWCKKIRDVSGNWRQIEDYIADHSHAEFSHGICPECKRSIHTAPGGNSPNANPAPE